MELLTFLLRNRMVAVTFVKGGRAFRLIFELIRNKAETPFVNMTAQLSRKSSFSFIACRPLTMDCRSK